MASAADIRSWSATGLAARTVAQLQALATTTGVDLLDVNDASRGSRRGRPLLKADYISSLLRLAHPPLPELCLSSQCMRL